MLALPQKRVFKPTIESILLYVCESLVMTNAAEKKVDGTYTRMLRRVKSAFWRNRLSNTQLYGQISKLSTISKIRRLTLAGHVARHNKPANILLFWISDETCTRERPNIILKNVLQKNTRLTSKKLRTTVADSQVWRRNYVMPPILRLDVLLLLLDFNCFSRRLI